MSYNDIAEFVAKIRRWIKNPSIFLALLAIPIAAGVDAYFGKSFFWKFLVAIVAISVIIAILFFTYVAWKNGSKDEKFGACRVFEKIFELVAGFVHGITNVRLRRKPIRRKKEEPSNFSDT